MDMEEKGKPSLRDEQQRYQQNQMQNSERETTFTEEQGTLPRDVGEANTRPLTDEDPQGTPRSEMEPSGVMTQSPADSAPRTAADTSPQEAHDGAKSGDNAGGDNKDMAEEAKPVSASDAPEIGTHNDNG